MQTDLVSNLDERLVHASHAEFDPQIIGVRDELKKHILDVDSLADLPEDRLHASGSWADDAKSFELAKFDTDVLGLFLDIGELVAILIDFLSRLGNLLVDFLTFAIEISSFGF